MDNILFSWEFNDNKNRGKLWYIITFSIALGLIIWGFLSQLWALSIVIIILTGVAFYIENNTSDIISVQITDKGIRVADSFFPFSNINYFSIIYEGEQAIILRVILNQKIRMIPIDIKINNSIINNIRTILSEYITEEQGEELTNTEKLIRILKL